MSIKLWADVEDLKADVEALKKKNAITVSVDDIAELVRQNNELAARVETLEKKLKR